MSSMSVVQQKSFERFVRLAPLRFDGTHGEKAYDFLTECLSALRSGQGVWRPVCSPLMGWELFTKDTSSIMLSSGTFQSIINHSRMIESIRHARQGSGTKKFHH
ncbi:hypothetical protein H5410_027472 [Solanum commersonii]|uniref:Uncharacterized protein n=1 Tax=Solanum commersonii TaxID=4109 RepID=A0A9J5Z3G7_SOLCO|nr:hypothetical protein H5410_027472 [Solanum commersonii]